ncbi:MAG: DNA mismatch repair endonuclease MutL [Idiomarina sp.]|nr:DNA mismatch repair endonuclease MutL [Idiomarina sp.]
MPIRQLPLQLANQIAAGEVVERPSSVVKELVENSIDAGATELLIDIEQGGAKRIRIRDNGSGIVKDELQLALSRHATSKIHTLDDLESILSLGFRGEALASISSVSRLTLTSKPGDQAEAWQAFCEGRDMQVHMQPAAHPDGTTVDVQDLFFNTPARRKFLRTEKTEFGHIDEVLRRIALAAPQVRILFTHNGRKVRDYRALRGESGNLHEAALPRLKAVAGSAFAAQAVYLQHDSEPWQLHGWVAPAEHCRHQHDIQYMYVNGRMMKDKLLNHAIRQAYGDTLADDRQPTFVLYLQIPARDVDVNVHPAKHEVRFHQARQVHDFVLQTLRQALPETLSGTVVETSATDEGSQPTGFQPPPRHAYQQPSPQALHVAGQAGAVAAHPPQQNTQEYRTQAAAGYQTLMSPGVGEPQNSDALNSAPDAEWRLLKVLEQRYVLVHQAGSSEASSVLALADLAQLQQQVETQRIGQQLRQGLSGQPLLLPVQLNLDTPLTDPLVHQLSQLGVQLKRLQAHRAIVMQVPAVLRQRSTVEAVSALIAQLTDAPLTEQTDLHRWLAAQGVHSQYSDQQAQYWFTQALALGLLEAALRPLDWRTSIQS